MEEVEGLIELLSPIEREVLPYLKLKSESKIIRESKFDAAKVKRALAYLDNKGIIKLKFTPKSIVAIGENGTLYLKNELPERRLLNALASAKKELSFKDAKEKAKLNDNEFSVALGMLKKKAFMDVREGNLSLRASPQDAAKKFIEEKLLSELPLDLSTLSPEYQFALNNLKSRKDIVRVEEVKESSYEITPLGSKVLAGFDKVKASIGSTVEALTPEMLSSGSWKGKKFRHYDIKTKVPMICGGKKHPYHEFLKEVRENLISLGFEEASGPLVELSFFNSDALFMPQDHPARGIHDLYFAKPQFGDLRRYAQILKNVKQTHETGGNTGSEGWKVPFSEKESSRLVLRSQGTAVSARILASGPKVPGKYFSIARCYRPDIVDASHNTEFNQLEGIVIDKNVNFSQLLGLLKMFAKKITGTDKVKFLPSYFPFTEPSVEGYLYHEELGKWIEVLPAGIFRPELTAPLGIKEKVLAWGLGIDRLYMIKENIKDIREIFTTDLGVLRK